ncbi:hypothetical protein ES703_81818 [subsurface metagenome]
MLKRGYNMITKEVIQKYKKAKKKAALHSITIEPEDKVDLEMYAEKFDINLALLIRIIIKEFLKEQKKGES